MAIIITGGYGLLGSHLAYKFAREGEEIIIVDTKKRELDYLEALGNNPEAQNFLDDFNNGREEK